MNDDIFIFDETGTILEGVKDRTIKSVTIPDSVTSIGESAFIDCSRLTSVTIPNSVTRIGYEAFRACSGLTSIDIPDSVTSIAGRTFEGCSNLASVTIGSNVTSIGKAAFSWCSKLSSIKIGESVTIIGESAFSYCRSLKSIIIPNNIITVGNAAFSNCILLESISFNYGLTEIGTFAFNKCENLISIGIPFGIKTLKDNTFSYCEKLTHVTIPEGVTSIGNETFKGCYRLSSINIPNSLTIIENGAFEDCKSLVKVRIPNSVRTIGEKAFYGCPIKEVFLPIFTKYNYNTFDEQTKVNKEKVFISYSRESEEHNKWVEKLATDLQNVGVDVILDLWNIKDGSSFTDFSEAVYSSRIVLCILTPQYKSMFDKKVGYIGYEASIIISKMQQNHYIIPLLRYGDSAKSIPILMEDRIFLDMRDDDNYDKCFVHIFTIFLQIPTKEKVGSTPLLFIDDGKTIIGVTNKSLTSISIPNSVINIGNEAFIGCNILSSIFIPDSVTSIGDRAFSGCKNLININIPNSVKTIGEQAFEGCPINEILIPESTEYYPNSFDKRTIISRYTNYTFSRENNQENRIIQEKESLIISEDRKTIIGVSNNSINSYSIPSDVTNIGEGAFSGCNNLTSITIPDNVTSIGKRAFYMCKSLECINISKNVTRIGEETFAGCTKLGDLVIPDSVKSIGKRAFYMCKSLECINVSKNVTRIGEESFAGCTKLGDLVIPDSVTSIGKRAFYMCDSLTSISIPQSVTNIEEGSFSGCSGLMSIEVNENNIKYDSRNNCKAIIDKNTNTLIVGCKNTVIPNSVTSIGSDAFSYCLGLTSIDIPNSVTSIGDRAFSGCTGLTSVTIPDSVKTIGDNAFALIGILAFIQILANKLECQYTLSKEQSKQNRVENFIPYGTIYKKIEGKPFVIIEMMNENNEQQNKKDNKEELFKLQNFLGILWSVIFDDNTIYLRPLYGDEENIEDVFKIAEKIEKGNISHSDSTTLLNDEDLGKIKEIISDNLDGISKKDSLIRFANSLKKDDIVIEEGGIYLTDAKETEFFNYLLMPVEKKELWRYTTKNSLFLTLKDHYQNMLSLNCMNDISEIDYADKYIDRKTCFLSNAINEANKVYILSCCDDTKSDDLMMWRLYAEDGEGVSLCYNLDTIIDNKYFYLAYICYGKHNSHPELDYLKGIMELSLPPHFRFRKWNVWKHFFKPYEFNYEKEIRLIYFEHNNTSVADKTIWIVDNKSGIASPMKLFSLEKKTGKNNSFPLSLTKILIGPKSKEAEVNRVQFNKMFSEANITDSKTIPEISISKINIYR